MEKLKCLLSYFSQIVASTPEGLLTYQRLSLSDDQIPDWNKSGHTITKLHVDSQGMIETEGRDMLQVDFANKYVGGGVLRSGLVQEEIRFTICPELIVSLLFTEVLGDMEVLIVSGVRRFTNYSGYGDSFKFEGRHQDTTDKDCSGRLKTNIVAMDAIRFGSDKIAQFKMENIERELNKAFVAFSNPYPTEVRTLQAVATGNWGCGAFGGDVRLKLVIQLLAASVAGRDVAYFTFGDRSLVKDAGELCDELKGVEVGSVFKVIRQFCRSNKKKNGDELYNWILDSLKSDQVDSVSLLSKANDADTDDSVDSIKVKDNENDANKDQTVPDSFEEEFSKCKGKDGFFEALDKMEKGQVDTQALSNPEVKNNESKINEKETDPDHTEKALNSKSESKKEVKASLIRKHKKEDKASLIPKQSKITNFFPSKVIDNN